MSNINKHLLNDLFISKSVKCDENIYLKYYSEIWNDDSLYINFLSSTSEILQREYAKQIISRLNYSLDFVVPSFIFNFLIEDEIKEFSDPDGSYQGQIHFVHSVMMYILGIWIYFNHPVFHKFINIQLSEEFNKIECYREFILIWKNIAITHDLGYVFENNISAKKICKKEKFENYFCKYNKLDLHILYELTLKAVSKLIYIQIASNKSTKTLFEIFNKNKNESFKELNNDSISITNIFSPDDIADYKKLWMIESLDEYEPFVPLDTYLKPIIIVKDKNEKILNIRKYDSAEYVNELNIRQNILINNLDDDCFFEVYCFKPSYAIAEFLNHTCDKPHTYDYFCELADDLYNKYSYEFTISINNYLQKDFRYIIFRKLQKEYSYEDFINNEKYELSSKRDIIEASKKSILIECEKILDSLTFRKNANIPDSMYNELCDNINNNDAKTNVIRNIIEQENSSLNQKIKLFLNYFRSNSSHIKSNLISKIKVRNNNNKIYLNYDLFYWNLYKKSNIDSQTKYVIEELNDFIINHGMQTGIINENVKFEDLLNYHLYHSIYDHGITSSSILFHSIFANKTIINHRTNQYPILLSLYTDDFDTNQYDKIYLISIYAILLHNLYPNIYEDRFKKTFILDIFDNPISYFLAFCDNLQQWDRPRTIDYSRTEIKGDYIVGSSFDLEIIDNTIFLSCNTSSFKDVARKNRDNLNEYLKDASMFIKLELKEK